VLRLAFRAPLRGRAACRLRYLGATVDADAVRDAAQDRDLRDRNTGLAAVDADELAVVRQPRDDGAAGQLINALGGPLNAVADPWRPRRGAPVFGPIVLFATAGQGIRC
jgi:hypothetical protein